MTATADYLGGVLFKVNPAAAAADLDGHWVPQSIAGYNGDHVQVIKVLGEYVWHKHDRTDDLFMVLSGRVTVQTREQDIDLDQGELVVVPVGVEHRVRADEEACLLILEHLGDVEAEAGGETASATLFM